MGWRRRCIGGKMGRIASIVVGASLLASGVAFAAGGNERTDNGAPVSAVAGRPTNVLITTFTGNWSATAPAGTQTGRNNRNTIASTCSGVALTTPPFDAATYQSSLSAHTFVNPYSTATCFTFTLTNSSPATCGFNLQPNLYVGSFNPANISQNWVGTAGLSSGTGPTATVTFNALVPANGTAVYVINNTNPVAPAAVACDYRVAVEATIDQVVPTMSPQWLMSLALLLGVFGFFGYRRYAATR